MRTIVSLAVMSVLLLLISCDSPDYKVTAPPGWSVKDTTLFNKNVCLIIGPESLADAAPMVNIIVMPMEGRTLDNFTIGNMNYLEQNMATVVIANQGNMDIAGIDARWFTYSKAEDGVKRDMINYIIPYKGFAYMITGGTNSGTMQQYRSVFDQIARSFKARQ